MSKAFHFSLSRPMPGYVMISYFTVKDGVYKPGQSQSCTEEEFILAREHLERSGWTEANAIWNGKQWEIVK